MENVPPFCTSTTPWMTESRSVSFAPSPTIIFTLDKISIFTNVRLHPFGKINVCFCAVPSDTAYPSAPYVPLVWEPYHAFTSAGTVTLWSPEASVKFLIAHGSISYIYFPSAVFVQFDNTSWSFNVSSPLKTRNGRLLLVAVCPSSSVIDTLISYVPAFAGVPANVREPSWTEYTPAIPESFSLDASSWFTIITEDSLDFIRISLSLKSFQSSFVGSWSAFTSATSTLASLFLFCVTFVDAPLIASYPFWFTSADSKLPTSRT